MITVITVTTLERTHRIQLMRKPIFSLLLGTTTNGFVSTMRQATWNQRCSEYRRRKHRGAVSVYRITSYNRGGFSRELNAIGRVRPSVCFHTYRLTSDLDFGCVWLRADLTLQVKVIRQGQRLIRNVRLCVCYTSIYCGV